MNNEKLILEKLNGISEFLFALKSEFGELQRDVSELKNRFDRLKHRAGSIEGLPDDLIDDLRKQGNDIDHLNVLVMNNLERIEGIERTLRTLGIIREEYIVDFTNTYISIIQNTMESMRWRYEQLVSGQNMLEESVRS